MKFESACSRRQFMKLGGMALSAFPILLIADHSRAATNAAMRNGMKYQDKPNGDKSCAKCNQFIAGKAASDAGGCKLFAGDTEISPNGYCVAWTPKSM